MKIAEKAVQTFGQSKAGMGTAVWLRHEPLDLDLVINDNRTQVFNPDAFSQLGMDLGAKRAVVVKSTQHFYAGFAPIASEVLYVAAPGAITPDFANIPFQTFKDPYWPNVADPHGE